MSVLPIEYVSILPVFLSLLFDVGTSKLTSEQFTHKIGATTGGISVGKMNGLRRGKDGAIADTNDIAFRMIVSGKATADNAAAMFDFMHMGITDSKLDSKDRALEALKATLSSMQSSLKSSGNSYASTRMYARRSLSGYIDELTGGITYFEALPALIEEAEKNWPKLLAKLQHINSLLFQKFLINLSGDKKTLEKVDPLADAFIQKLQATAKEQKSVKVEGPLVSDAMKGKPQLRLAQEDEGFVVTTPVNYVVKGGGLYTEGEQVTGDVDVVIRLISQSYMWDKIRVMGGAYGGGCSVSHYSGTFVCYSYRDPNLKSTLDTFDAVATYLEKLTVTDDEVQQLIIGAVGELDKPTSPASQGYSSMASYLVNDKLSNRQKRRDEMLAATPDSFKQFAKL